MTAGPATNGGTWDLRWIVDAYNLTFAAFVLAAGSLSTSRTFS